MLDISKLLELDTAKEIIDEMFTQSYHMNYNSNSHILKVNRLKKTDIIHPFDQIFKGCETIVKNIMIPDKFKFDYSYEYVESESWEQEARLLLYQELLNLANNKTAKYKFDTVNDFKAILTDIAFAEEVKAYLYTIIKNKVRKMLYCEGKVNSQNRDFYHYRKQVDNVRTVVKVENKYYPLDKPAGESDGANKYSILDIVYNQDNIEEMFLVNTSSLYNYVINNRQIFTKKQNVYLDKIFNNSNLKLPHKVITEENIVKKAFERLAQDKNIQIKSGQVSLKNIDYINFIDKLLLLNTNLEKLDFLCNALRKSDFLSHYISDLIYSLDYNLYKHIVNYYNTKTIDTEYLNNAFADVLSSLIKEYNYCIKDKKLEYTVEISNLTNEEIIASYIEKYVFIDDNVAHGYIAKSGNDKNLKTLNDINDFINKLLSVNFDRKQMYYYLNNLNYNIQVGNKTTKFKTGCYKCFRL